MREAKLRVKNISNLKTVREAKHVAVFSFASLFFSEILVNN